MIKSADVLHALKNEYTTNRLTQQEIADKSGVARSYICDLLNGKKSIDGLTLRKINALFPDATINLSGEQNNITVVNAGTHSQSYGSSKVIGRIEHYNSAADMRGEVVNRLVRQIMDAPELDASTKVQIFQLITTKEGANGSKV